MPEFEDIGFVCPACQSAVYGTWAFPHPLIVHWVLNPGLAVNEVLLGQRIPKITYYCKACGSETTYIRYYRNVIVSTKRPSGPAAMDSVTGWE